MPGPQRALVLGAGGYAALGWEIGFLAGMADAGLDPREADLFVGTSAGAIVAAQLTSGEPLEELVGRCLAVARGPQPAAPSVDFQRWRADIQRARSGPGGPEELLRRVGAIALAFPPGTPSDRPVVEALLPRHEWPRQRLLAVAVDVRTGERRAFDRASGIGLVDAVTASGVVPGLAPPVSFRGHEYMDGGFYSTTNADLASGCDAVLVLALRARSPPISAETLETGVERLRAGGARVEVVHPDEATEAAFASVGGNLFDPGVSAPAVHAGRAQGRRMVGGRTV